MEPIKKTIELSFPFEHGGEQITQLVMRRPKVKDLKKAARDPDQAAATFTMIGNLAQVAPELLDEIDAEDFGKVTDWLESVLPKEKLPPVSTS